MKDIVESISAEDPSNVTREAAEQVGKQMGMAVTAAIVSIDFTRYVGIAFHTMKQSSCYQDFLSALVKEIEEGLKSGMEGMRSRAHMARHMQAGHVAMRAQLHEMALKDGPKDVDVLDSLLETGGIVERAVNALLAPIEGNLRQLCDESKQMQAMKRAHEAHQNALMDHIRDTVKDCEDPDCPIHKTH